METMTRQEVRLECLRLAVESEESGSDRGGRAIVSKAAAFEAYVTGSAVDASAGLPSRRAIDDVAALMRSEGGNG